MKKFAIAAFAAIVSTGAVAADSTAEMVFTGTVPTTTPSSTLAITGVGGGALESGSLIIDQDGTFGTSTAVNFEIREVTDAGIGNPATGALTMTATKITLSSNGAVVTGVYPTAALESGDQLPLGSATTVSNTGAVVVENKTPHEGVVGNIITTVSVMVAKSV